MNNPNDVFHIIGEWYHNFDEKIQIAWQNRIVYYLLQDVAIFPK